MKPKTEIKDPASIDSLLESKEQTDKALAELADSLRNKLERLETVLSKESGVRSKESGVKNGGLTLPSNDPTTAESSVDVSPPFIELRISKQFGTWFLRVVAFVVMFLFIWGAMALLKEPKANGKANAPVQSEIVAEHPEEPAGEELGVRSEELEGNDDVDASVTSDSSPTVQRPRIRFFQRRP